jgi:zinc-ribbon family
MIIFGTRVRHKTLSTGQFYCPNCKTQRNYDLRRARNYFALYFIPIIPMNTVGEYVTCQTCSTNFNPDVLKMAPPPVTAMDRITLETRADLDSGTPIEFARQKLINTGLKMELIDQTIAAAAGSDRSRCPKCSLTYRSTVKRCAQDGSDLLRTAINLPQG